MLYESCCNPSNEEEIVDVKTYASFYPGILCEIINTLRSVSTVFFWNTNDAPTRNIRNSHVDVTSFRAMMGCNVWSEILFDRCTEKEKDTFYEVGQLGSILFGKRTPEFYLSLFNVNYFTETAVPATLLEKLPSVYSTSKSPLVFLMNGLSGNLISLVYCYEKGNKVLELCGAFCFPRQLLQEKSLDVAQQQQQQHRRKPISSVLHRPIPLSDKIVVDAVFSNYIRFWTGSNVKSISRCLSAFVHLVIYGVLPQQRKIAFHKFAFHDKKAMDFSAYTRIHDLGFEGNCERSTKTSLSNYRKQQQSVWTYENTIAKNALWETSDVGLLESLHFFRTFFILPKNLGDNNNNNNNDDDLNFTLLIAKCHLLRHTLSLAFPKCHFLQEDFKRHCPVDISTVAQPSDVDNNSLKRKNNGCKYLPTTRREWWCIDATTNGAIGNFELFYKTKNEKGGLLLKKYDGMSDDPTIVVNSHKSNIGKLTTSFTRREFENSFPFIFRGSCSRYDDLIAKIKNEKDTTNNDDLFLRYVRIPQNAHKMLIDVSNFMLSISFLLKSEHEAQFESLYKVDNEDNDDNGGEYQKKVVAAAVQMTQIPNVLFGNAKAGLCHVDIAVYVEAILLPLEVDDEERSVMSLKPSEFFMRHPLQSLDPLWLQTCLFCACDLFNMHVASNTSVDIKEQHIYPRHFVSPHIPSTIDAICSSFAEDGEELEYATLLVGYYDYLAESFDYSIYALACRYVGNFIHGPASLKLIKYHYMGKTRATPTKPQHFKLRKETADIYDLESQLERASFLFVENATPRYFIQ